MSRRRGKKESSQLVSEFYKTNDGWSWEVRDSGKKLRRYFSSGFKSLEDALKDFIDETSR